MLLGKDKKRACIDITNTGPGIPAKQHDQIFARFYRGDPSRSRKSGGFGLGLRSDRFPLPLTQALKHHGQNPHCR